MITGKYNFQGRLPWKILLVDANYLWEFFTLRSTI